MESQAATTVTKEIWMNYVARFGFCFYFSSFASFFSFSSSCIYQDLWVLWRLLLLFINADTHIV